MNFQIFKAMGICDDPSTAAVLERIEHRRARQNFESQSTSNGRDLDSLSVQVFANPPPPAASGPPRSKYAGAVPK